MQGSKRKVVRTEGIELPDGSVSWPDNEESGYKYLGILEVGRIKENELKSLFKRESMGMIVFDG